MSSLHRKTGAWVIMGIVLISALVYTAWPIAQADKTSIRNQSLHGRGIFPPDDPWNTNISQEAVDENSSTLIAAIGADRPLHPDFGTTYHGAPLGIPYVVVSGD